MRPLLFLIVSLCAGSSVAQSTPLINEVCASNHGNLTDAEGRTPDWIELHNPGSKAIELMGWRIATNGKQQVIDAALRIPAKGHLLLHCDGKPERGATHLGFTLPRTGGAILLIAPDGTTIADLFTYPALPADASIGRMPDGAKSWSWFAEPTPGGSNATVAAMRGRSKAPVIRTSGRGPLLIEIASEGTVHFTLDGSDPSAAHATLYDGPIRVERGSIVRAIAREAGRYESEEAVLPIPAQAEATNAISLALNPADLFGDSLGIYHPGAQQNHTRKGRAWEREALLLIGHDAMPVGARIFGSGSRSLGKRSFKLVARDRYDSPADGFAFGDGTRVHEGILRADASPHAFLRNAVMEELVERFDLNVDVQPSTAHPLYLNGAYWGLYRWMPAKDAEWLKQRSNAEALDVLEGPAATERSGSDAHFQRAQRLLVSGAPIDSIDAMIDTRSLIDLACIDLWTGRADHDLNVRCYRPKEKGGRWRWVLFDMDLWAPPNENSVQRMSLAMLPETPFVPQLIAHATLQSRLLARMTALQSAAFAQVGSIADIIHRAHHEELIADYKRWDLQLDLPTPDASLAEMKDFATQRPAHLFAHLAKHTGKRLRETTIEAPPADQGVLLLEGLALAPGKHAVRCFEGVPILFELRAAPGHEFAGWQGAEMSSASGSIDLWKVKRLRAVIRSVVP